MKDGREAVTDNVRVREQPQVRGQYCERVDTVRHQYRERAVTTRDQCHENWRLILRERERWATQHCTHLRMDAEKISCAIVVEPQVLEVMCVASLAALEGFTTHRTECLVGGGGRVFGWRPSRRRWHKGTIGHILAHICGSDVVT